MAGRGGPKLKEYRTHVTSVRHWLKECEYEGIISQFLMRYTDIQSERDT
jgi:hypothetical protein